MRVYKVVDQYLIMRLLKKRISFYPLSSKKSHMFINSGFIFKEAEN